MNSMERKRILELGVAACGRCGVEKLLAPGCFVSGGKLGFRTDACRSCRRQADMARRLRIKEGREAFLRFLEGDTA